MTYNKLFLEQYKITEKEYKVYIDTIKESYRNAYKETQKLLTKTYAKLANVKPENYYNEMIKFKRYESLLKQIKEEYSIAVKQTGKALVEGGSLNMTNMYYRSQYCVEWTGSIIYPVLDQNLVTATVTGSIKAWSNIKDKELWQGLLPEYGTLSDLLNKNAVADLAKIRQTLTTALIRGESFTKTAKAMRGAFNNSANNALRVARTEGIRNLNSGAYALGIDAQNLGIETSKMWDATLDTRVRETHGRADRQKRKLEENYNVGGAVGLFPAQLDQVGENVNCRCASINLAGDLEPQTRRARNPVKEMQWQNATSTERRNRQLKDGTRIYPRSEQTDIIQNRSFTEWASLHNLKYNKSGKIVVG